MTTHRAVQHPTAMAGVEARTLASARTFPRHAHDQFGIGLMVFGGHRSWSAVGQVEPQAGDVIASNPGEVHDGVPHEGRARGWRMLYLDPELVRGLAGEDAPRLEIARPAVRDPVLAGLVARAFARATDPGADRLGVEEDLLRSLVRAMRGTPDEAGPRACPAVARARQRLDDAPEAPASLAELARLAGVSRFQLLRGFAREVGVTPHRYLVQRRVGLARRLLARGEAPAAAALAAGFADQSHMSRAFVRQFGITPGRYRRALA